MLGVAEDGPVTVLYPPPLALHNGVSQGLSAGIFTSDQAEAERFLAPDGADTGIANVNVGTFG